MENSLCGVPFNHRSLDYFHLEAYHMDSLSITQDAASVSHCVRAPTQ